MRCIPFFEHLDLSGKAVKNPVPNAVYPQNWFISSTFDKKLSLSL